MIIAVIDGSAVLHEEDFLVLEKVKDKNAIITINKSDLPVAEDMEARLNGYSNEVLKISAKTGLGLDALKDMILDLATAGSPFGERSGVILTNVRHKVAIDNAMQSLNNASDALRSKQPLEIIAVEMRDALDRLGEIVGTVTTEDIINKIFSEFCIGK